MIVQITCYIIVEQDEAIIFTGFYLEAFNLKAKYSGEKPVATQTH